MKKKVTPSTYKTSLYRLKIDANTVSGRVSIVMNIEMVNLTPDELLHAAEQLASHIIAVIPNTPYLQANLTHVKVSSKFP